MVRAFTGTLLLVAVILVARAQAADPLPPIVVKLPIRGAAKQPRALKYQLLPDQLDMVPGNAAPFWLRAGQSAAHVKRKLTDAEYKWLNADETALQDLPRDQVRTLLDEYRIPLRFAEEAARRDHCDWELP